MKIITIDREYAAGGHTVGRALAKKLGVEIYDKDIIKHAAKKSGIEQGLVEDDEERISKVGAFLKANIDGQAPTLVFAPNCWALPDIYRCFRDYYPLMPDRVGLLGFDNTEWVDVASPAVSVVVQPAREEGSAAARILLDAIAEKDSAEPHQVLDCHVHWGETTL